MRKLIALCLTLATLTGCGAAAMAEVQLSPPPLAAEAPLSYEVKTQLHEDTAFTADGTTLAQVSFELPELTVLRTDGTEVSAPENDAERAALAAAEAFNLQFQEWTQDSMLRELAAWAEEDYAYRPEFFTESNGYYVEDLDYAVYCTDQLISVYAVYYSFTGGAHGNTVLLAWNFDLTTGSFLQPTALAADGQAFLDAVTGEIVEQAQAVAAGNGLTAEEFYWPNYQEISAGWSGYAVFFDQDGMNVGFSPYELACYAAGPQTFTIPYETLRPLLSDRGLALLGLDKGRSEENPA